MGIFKKKKYSHKLTPSSEKTYTVLPGYGINGLIMFLDYNKIDYKVIQQYQFPEGIPGGYRFLGKEGLDDVYAVVSNISSDDLHEIAEETYYLPWENITDESPVNIIEGET